MKNVHRTVFVLLFSLTVIIHVIDGKIYLPETCEGYKHNMGGKEVIQIKCEDKDEDKRL